jgi:diguanylate cyclase (GGDEF)-like protein
MMIDVDDFKLLNDTLGHAAGDDLLRNIAQLIRSSLREQDQAFRYGGDEFCLVLPDTSGQHGQALARRLTLLVDTLGQSLRVPRPPRLCIGMAGIDEERDPTQQSLLARADAQLYQIKKSRKKQRGAA